MSIIQRYGDSFWDDARTVPGAFQFGGAADPTLSDWQPGGAGATYKVLKFAKNDEIFATVQIPHRYREGADIEAHVHWTPCDRGAAEGAGVYVGWKVDYSWANINDAFPSSTTLFMTGTCSGTDDDHLVGEGISAIDGDGMDISSIMMCRVYREDSGGNDTWASAVGAQQPALLEFDLHIPIDSPGSEDEFVKYAFRP